MNSLHSSVRQGFLAAGVPSRLVDELLEAFVEAKRRYYRGDLRPNAVEGGRFSEAAFRILQWATCSGKYTALDKALPGVDKLLADLQNTSGHDSIRVHIPRTLRLIYDIRNRRDAAHLADGIDPNIQDATLVVHNMEWVLAELVRLYHSVSPAEAHGAIVELVSKEVPVIQEFDGFPRILRDMRASDYCLVLLYWRGTRGVTLAELSDWVRPTMKANIRRTITTLEKKHFLHVSEERIHLTRLGEEAVETARLVEPA